MATSVTFYALSDAPDSSENGALPDVGQQALQKAAELALESLASKAKISVLCTTQHQAEAFDEYIWQHPPDRFIPHNLYGEGPDMGTPVEILWEAAYMSMTRLRNKAVLINLSQTYIENQNGIQHIIDFVPSEEALKVAARERYKRYKQAGCQLEYKNL